MNYHEAHYRYYFSVSLLSLPVHLKRSNHLRELPAIIFGFPVASPCSIHSIPGNYSDKLLLLYSNIFALHGNRCLYIRRCWHTPGDKRSNRSATTFKNLIEEIELADQVGLSVFGVGEHHRPDYAVSVPSVILGAAAVKQNRSNCPALLLY